VAGDKVLTDKDDSGSLFVTVLFGAVESTVDVLFAVLLEFIRDKYPFLNRTS
jgi:hypothetical protein